MNDSSEKSALEIAFNCVTLYLAARYLVLDDWPNALRSQSHRSQAEQSLQEVGMADGWMDSPRSQDSLAQLLRDDRVLQIGAHCRAPFSFGTSLSFITAYNPHSTPVGPAENTAANQALRMELLKHTPFVLPARGESTDSNWQEPSFLAIDVPLPVVDDLARRFKQDGIVHGLVGGTYSLRLYGSKFRPLFEPNQVIDMDTANLVWLP